MTFLDTAILLTGGGSLAALVGYLSWVDLRSIILKTEILESYAKFKVECINLNAERDPAYREMCEIFDAVLEMAKFFSLPLFAYLGSVRKDDETPVSQLATPNPDLEKAIVRATDSIVPMIAYHVTFRTFSGIVAYFLLRLVPRPIVKFEARQVVYRSMRPLQGFYHTRRFGRC